MSRKRRYTDVKFVYYDGNAHTVRLVVGDWEDGSVTLEGDDLDMVTAAFFHLRGYIVEPGLKRYGLRKYKNGGTTTITDDRLSYRKRNQRVPPVHYSLDANDDRPGQLRLWVQCTRAKVWLNFSMDRKTADEFGRRLAAAAEWDAD